MKNCIVLDRERERERRNMLYQFFVGFEIFKFLNWTICFLSSEEY